MGPRKHFKYGLLFLINLYYYGPIKAQMGPQKNKCSNTFHHLPKEHKQLLRESHHHLRSIPFR